MKRLIIGVIVVFAFVFSFSVSVVMGQEPCEGNFDFDEDVDGSDAAVFKSDFGRSPFSNPCPVSPCPVTCEGTLSAGGRWCDQGDGTVKDMTNGLVWLKKADWGGQWPLWDDYNNPDGHSRAAELWDGSPWEGIANLSDGSVEGDWRLPTKSELVGITVGNEQITSSQMYLFTGVQPANYYSGTSYAGSPGQAWSVNMTNGYVGSGDKDVDIYYIWPVRGDH